MHVVVESDAIYHENSISDIHFEVKLARKLSVFALSLRWDGADV